MTKTEMFCHKYSNPRHCAGYCSNICNTCCCYDVVDVGYCDNCGTELDDEEFCKSGELELCPDCMEKLKGAKL